MVRRVYFDTSALNRPFDDQAQIRIRLEAEAVEHLLRAVGEGRLEWISSDIVLFEVKKCPDTERRGMLELLYGAAGRASCALRVFGTWTRSIWQRPSRAAPKCS